MTLGATLVVLMVVLQMKEQIGKFRRISQTISQAAPQQLDVSLAQVDGFGALYARVTIAGRERTMRVNYTGKNPPRSLSRHCDGQPHKQAVYCDPPSGAPVALLLDGETFILS